MASWFTVIKTLNSVALRDVQSLEDGFLAKMSRNEATFKNGIAFTCTRCNIMAIDPTFEMYYKTMTLVDNPIEGNVSSNSIAAIGKFYISVTDPQYLRDVYLQPSGTGVVNIPPYFGMVLSKLFDFNNTVAQEISIQFGPSFTADNMEMLSKLSTGKYIKRVALEDPRAVPPPLPFPTAFKNINFDAPLDYIGLQNSNLNNLQVEGSTRFLIDGTAPFNNIPEGLNSYIFRNCNVDKLPELPTFNGQTIDIKYNKITGPLPTQTLGVVMMLDNNLFDGQVPQSYCYGDSTFSNNQLSGNLPTCFPCHLADPVIIPRIKGNNFDNYKDWWTVANYLPCTTIKVTNVTGLGVSSAAYMTITGVDLGWNDNIISNTVVSSVGDFTIPNLIFRSGTVINYQKLARDGGFNMTFGTTTPPTTLFAKLQGVDPPVIVEYKVSPFQNLGYIFNFNGTGFPIAGTASNPIDKFNITSTVGPYPCVPYSSTNRIYACVVYGQIPENKYTATYTMIGLSASIAVDFKRTFPYITAVDSCPMAGGRVVLYGNYGTNFTGPVITIGALDCQLVSINNTMVECDLVEAGTPGIKSINITVAGVICPAGDIFAYLEDSKSCPGNCSGHGTCERVTGTCYCEVDWHGPSCSVLVSTPIPPVVSSNGTTMGDDTKFGFSLVSIREMTMGHTEARRVNLTEWTKAELLDKDTWTFSTTFEEATITYSVREFKVAEEIVFAGVTMPMSIGAIKLT
eukprot:gene12373-14516_t